MPHSSISSGSIAFLGFGEAAHAFLEGWRTGPDFKARICAYDIKTDLPDTGVRTAKRADYAAAKVLGASTAAEAVTGAEAIFSVVTADQAHKAAKAALPGLAKGAFFFDCDSCAPQTKLRSSQDVEAAGGRYVDVAVMAAVHPRLHQTPLLISGPHAEAAAPELASLGMSATIHDGPVGAASAVKMIRSVMMKGLEALVCECVLAGQKAGVIEAVLDSARRHLSRLRLEEPLGLYAGAGDDPWAAAGGGNARSGADRRSVGSERRNVARLGRLGAGDRRTRFARDRGGRRRLSGSGRPNSRRARRASDVCGKVG